MKDLVSVVLICRNESAHLEESIASVLAQTVSGWELLIVDDCSDDRTASIVISYLMDRRIRFFKNKRPLGAARSRSFALREAKGRWIAFLGAGDLWKADKLERQIAFMEAEDCAFSYTNCCEIDAACEATGKQRTGPRRISRRGMRRCCWMSYPTVMYDAQSVGELSYPDRAEGGAYALWLRVAQRRECRLLDAFLACDRKRETSDEPRGVRDYYRLFRRSEGRGRLAALCCGLRGRCFELLRSIRYTKG